MKKLEAYSISIGVLGAVDTYLTATIIPLPVWVTFIAWASFFILGGKASGLSRTKHRFEPDRSSYIIFDTANDRCRGLTSNSRRRLCWGRKCRHGSGLQASAAKRDSRYRVGIRLDGRYCCRHG